MAFSPRLGLTMQALDVFLKSFPVHTPDTTAPDLDCGQFARSHEGVGLLTADVEVRGNVVEREKTRFARAIFGLGSADHRPRLTPRSPVSFPLAPFVSISREESCK